MATKLSISLSSFLSRLHALHVVEDMVLVSDDEFHIYFCNSTLCISCYADEEDLFWTAYNNLITMEDINSVEFMELVSIECNRIVDMAILQKDKIIGWILLYNKSCKNDYRGELYCPATKSSYGCIQSKQNFKYF